MKGKIKSTKGITLIALIITIIVLIILAGISVNLLIGDNGIITRAKDAKIVQEKADIISKIRLDIAAKQVDKKGEITLSDIETILDTYGDVTKSNGVIVSFTPEGKEYSIPFTDIYEGELDSITYTITYMANGGSGSMNPTTAVAPQVAVCTFTAPTSGKQFKEWNTSDNGQGTKVTVGSTVSQNTTLYAIWEDAPEPEPLTIGDTVNYTTTLNEQTLNNWKVFYVDGNYTYLIYADLLKNLTEEGNPFNISGLDSYYTGVKADSRTDLLNAMTTTSNWSDLINNGEINGIALSTEVKNNANVWAMGSPTVELWINSWNTSYPSNPLYIDYSENVWGYGYDGYFIGTEADPEENDSRVVLLNGSTGTEDTLYFFTNEGFSDYWLASPGVESSYDVFTVAYNQSVPGCVGGMYSYNDDAPHHFRPVIKLPTSVLNQ